MTSDLSRTAPAASGLPIGRFEGYVAFQQLVRDALAMAATEGWREIVLCDEDFHDWPLGERVVADALNDWAGGGRRFTIIATQYDEIVRRHARFVQWRRTWDHIITCRRCPSADRSDLPSVLWSPGWMMHRIDRDRCVGVSGTEPDRRVLMRETLTEWIQNRSSPGFPATTLGL